MKLAFTSDIHVDSSPRNVELVRVLAERLIDIAPDVFVLAGDIGSERDKFAEGLAAFADLTCPKLVVPGNHDIWIDSNRQLRKGIDSTRKYFEILPDICRRHDFVPLWMTPYRIGDVGFIGSIGWYDYSFRNHKFDDEITDEMYAGGKYGRSMWIDMRRAWWLKQPIGKIQKPQRDRLCRPDGEICAEMIDALMKQADKVSADGVARIIAVIHHVPFKRMVKYINDLSWDFFATFLGSERMGEALLSNTRISHAICGHTHHKVDLTVGHLRALTSPVGYIDEWGTAEINDRVTDRLQVLEIA